jgi:hypothetical protein
MESSLLWTASTATICVTDIEQYLLFGHVRFPAKFGQKLTLRAAKELSPSCQFRKLFNRTIERRRRYRDLILSA